MRYTKVWVVKTEYLGRGKVGSEPVTTDKGIFSSKAKALRKIKELVKGFYFPYWCFREIEEYSSHIRCIGSTDIGDIMRITAVSVKVE